jgi:hypothetical protein
MPASPMMRKVDRAIPCAMGVHRAKRHFYNGLVALAWVNASRTEWHDPPHRLRRRQNTVL